MCVIIWAEKERPHPSMLEEAWKANDDGAGIAWREPAKNGEGFEVVWSKGHMEKAEILALCASVPLPYVVHFRRATVGAKKSYFTQPFEAGKKCLTGLTGRSREGVLFHNGTVKEWATYGKEAALRTGTPIPKGKWNDSRCLAWLTSLYGEGFMEFLPEQRGFFLTPDDFTIYWGDGWVRMKDKNQNEFLCSNDRPWTKIQTGPGYWGHHSYDRRPICRADSCWVRESLDSDFRCKLHPLAKKGINKQQDKQDSGGSPAKDPFPQKALTGKISLITLETAERLRQTKAKDGKRALGKGDLKAIKNLYKKMNKGGKPAEWALNDLARMSELLRSRGVIK